MEATDNTTAVCLCGTQQSEWEILEDKGVRTPLRTTIGVIAALFGIFMLFGLVAALIDREWSMFAKVLFPVIGIAVGSFGISERMFNNPHNREQLLQCKTCGSTVKRVVHIEGKGNDEESANSESSDETQEADAAARKAPELLEDGVRYCNQCGAQARDRFTYCYQCGSKIVPSSWTP